MTPSICLAASSSRKGSESEPLAAMTASKWNGVSNDSAWERSWRLPPVKLNCKGKPRASTRRWILLLNPPLLRPGHCSCRRPFLTRPLRTGAQWRELPQRNVDTAPRASHRHEARGTRVFLHKCVKFLPMMAGDFIGRHPTIVANLTELNRRQRVLVSPLIFPAHDCLTPLCADVSPPFYLIRKTAVLLR